MAEDVMQAILNDNDSSGANDTSLPNTQNPYLTGLVTRTGSYDPTTLYVRDKTNRIEASTASPSTSPGWAMLPRDQRREPVASALRTIAAMIGWDVKPVYVPSSNSWFLTWYEPRRDLNYPLFTVDPSEHLGVSDFSQDARQARPVVRCKYLSDETTTPVPPLTLSSLGITGIERVGWFNTTGDERRQIAFYEIEDTVELAIGLRRLMEFTERVADGINTIAEAQLMVAGAVRDTAEPEIQQSIQLPPMPEIELADLVRFRPNRQIHTASQDRAVQNVRTTFRQGAGTEIKTAGKPRARFKDWFTVESRPGRGKPGVLNPESPLGDLSQGELISVASSLFGTTDYLTGGKYVQVFNGNFQYFTGGLENVPDGWTISNDLWDGTTATTNMHLSSTSQSGRFSIVMDHTNGILRSRLIPIDLVDFTPFAFELVWRRANSPGTVPRVTFRWFDEDRAAIEPYGSGHSNRGLHPVETDPHWQTEKNARRVVDVNGTGGGGTEMILSVAVAETAQ